MAFPDVLRNVYFAEYERPATFFPAQNMSSSDYNDLLLRLYRLSHEQPIAEFQDSALELVKQVLPFDSAMWGSATLMSSGIDIHAIHLHKQPMEMLAAYEEVKHLDTAGQEAAGRFNEALAFDRDVWFRGKDQRAVRDYGTRFEQHHFFICATLEESTNLVRWLTLFRAKDSEYCLPRECLTLRTLAPHVQQALSLNRLAHLQQHPRKGAQEQLGVAMADARGVIYHMEPVFDHLLRLEWSGWRGPRLPADLMSAVQAGERSYSGQRVIFGIQVDHGLLWLRCRPRCSADALAPQELLVARMAAKGLTHKEIAKVLQRAPTTVRNQIRCVYEKLEISNVAELIDALRLTE